MSRSYRISVSESASRHVIVGDKAEGCLEVLEILAPECMEELLKKELEGRGFKVEEHTATRTDEKTGATITVDTKAGKITVELKRHENVTREAKTTVTGEEENKDHVDAQAVAAKEKLKKDAEAEIDKRTEELQREATAELEGILGGIHKEMEGVTNRVTVEALKTKARSMGEIEELHEGENGDLTIKVRV